MKKETQPKSVLDRWKNKDKIKPAITPILKAPKGERIPLSPGQERLWFLQQMYPENPFYNYSETYTFSGSLNEHALIESLKSVYNDHDILRTTYHLEDNRIFQKISKESDLEISMFDFSSLDKTNAKKESFKVMEAQANLGFDLARPPLIRAALIRTENSKHILQITLHHIVTDQWSMKIFREHLAHYYKDLANKLPIKIRKQVLQYTDYAYWLNKKEVNKKFLKYWKEKLSGELPKLNLPTDFARPNHPSFKGAVSESQTFSKALSSKVFELSKNLETTPYTLLLALYYTFLYRCSGQNDILVGSPISNRDQKPLENLVGFFIDTIVLRTKLNNSMSFRQLLTEVRKNTLEAFENKNIPFNVLVKELKTKRSLTANPFFQVMFLYYPESETPFFSHDLQVTHELFDIKVSKFDLTIYLSEKNGLLTSAFEYSTDLFTKSTVNRFQEYFKALLEGVVSNPDLNIGKIPMLSNSEKQFLFNKVKPISHNFKGFSGIHNIIEDIAKKHPNNLALTFGKNSITYKELNEKANRVAQELLNDSTTKNPIVGLCIERSFDMIIGLIGILKAGCAYLPIDPEYPTKRIDFILKDAKVDNIITQTSLLNLFDKFEVNQILMDTISYSNVSSYVELPVVKDTDLAYIIYTSGSTGRPKGVPITHKNIINSTGSRLDFYEENPYAFLLMSSISFDSSKAGIFWTLCTGGELIITPKRAEQDLDFISDIIKTHNVSHSLMLPSLYKIIIENIEPSKLKSLTTIIVAGETCSKSLCKTHFKTLPKVSLYNEYGPTEATVWSIAHKIEKQDLEGVSIPIGKPVNGVKIYILDTYKAAAPIGATGEIYIGGENLASGYLNRPQLTKDFFIENPIQQNGKLYKTGDLAKFNNEGNIEFLGRKDNQIKIRGFRVEIDDIENTINTNASIKQSVVLIKQKEGQPKRLIAYIKTNNEFNEEGLKQNLKQNLPGYMIPSRFILIEDMPLLPNGKINKKALGEIKGKGIIKTENIKLPKSDTENKIIQVWKDVLNIESLSTTDNFFEIGGDSILSIQIISKIRKIGVKISPNDLFENQTIKELASYIDNQEKIVKTKIDTFNHIIAVKISGSLAPLFCIHGGGSHFFFYNALSNYINPNRPVYAVQASAVEDDILLHDSIEEMAQDFVKEIKMVAPQGPYHIMGYCFSTAVALEISRILKQENQSVNLIIADTIAINQNRYAPDKTKRRVKGFFSRLMKNPFLAIYTFTKIRIDQYFRPFMIKITGSKVEKNVIKLRDNLANNYLKYEWTPNKQYTSLIITKRNDPTLEPEIIESWTKISKNNIKVIPIKGHHDGLFKEPEVGNTAHELDKCIEIFENKNKHMHETP